MSKVIILIGISNSGKTTWIKNEQIKNKNLKRLSRDDMRLMLDNYEISNRNEELITEINENLLYKLLSHKYDVALDSTHLRQSYINDVCDIVYKHNKLYNDNVEIILKYFPITLEEALERNEKRTGQPKVPEKVIKEMIERYNKSVPFIIKQPEDKTVTQNSNLPKAIIVDLDGSLAIHQGRSPYDETRVLEDKVDENVKETVLFYYNAGYKIICCSGRTEECRSDSELWLKYNNIPFEKLFMRKSGDHRKDYVVKEEIFRNNISPFYFVSLVLDDRNGVVSMYRNLGLKVFQVAPGDF